MPSSRLSAQIMSAIFSPQRNNEVIAVPNVTINPAEYVRHQLLQKNKQIEATANQIINNARPTWLENLSMCKMVMFCIVCCPCFVYTLNEARHIEYDAKIRANAIRMNQAETDAINELFRVLKTFDIEPPMPMMIPAKPVNVYSVAEKIILTINNALLNSEIKIMRSCLESLRSTVASAHEISLQDHLARGQDGMDEKHTTAQSLSYPPPYAPN